MRLDEIKHVHIIGICGTLMGAFAAYLKRAGIHVTGSDQNVYPPMSDVLTDAGVKLFPGYRAENVTGMNPKPDLVVIGNVISTGNPEARAAIDGGYRYTSLPEAMETLMLQKTRNLVVAGTHGKTTTSSMLAHVLHECGKNPSWFIGGVSQDLPYSFHVSSVDAGQPFVLEGDEYDTAFWDKVPKFNHYLPTDVILTSVEYDHADIYPDFPAVVRAFEGLMKRISSAGRLVACLDYAVIRDLAKLVKVPVLTYASDPSSGARFTPANIRVENEQTRFEVHESIPGSMRKVEELALGVSGNHNVMNALSVWIEACELGLPKEQVKRALASFKGVKRRQEVRGEVNGVLIIDDFAHHPTAVRETLKAFRLRYPRRRIIAVFEPRSATSRRKIFQKDYVDAFASADACFISTPYDQTKIAASDQFSSEQLVGDLAARGVLTQIMPSVDEGVIQVSKFTRPDDLVAVLSNGGFGGFISKLLESLKSRNTA